MTFFEELEAEEQKSTALVGKRSVIEAHNDPSIDEKDPAVNAKTGTKKTGFRVGKKYGPFRCDNCLHYEKKESACDNSHVLDDDEVPSKGDLKSVAADDFCDYFRNKDAKVPASAKLTAAAGLPKIEGFDDATTAEIREYLVQFPRKLLHYTERVVANGSLGAEHGKYLPETKTVEINPKNFTSKLKFGTHDPADIDEHVLAHELCHGVYENLSEEKQQGWMQLSGWRKGVAKGQALPYVETRPGWQRMVSNWTHSKSATFARKYQQKNPNEDFADSAAYYVTGNGDDLPEAKKKFIEELL